MRTVLSNTLTTQHLCKMFDVVPMTIYNWRKDLDLPFVALANDNSTRPRGIRFYPSEVKRWAKQNDKPILKQPKEILQQA